MKHKHDPICEHELEFCKDCQKVECSKCDQEWVPGKAMSLGTFTGESRIVSNKYPSPYEPKMMLLNNPFKINPIS